MIRSRRLIAAIDNELDSDFGTASRSPWQSLRPSPLGARHMSALLIDNALIFIFS